jgi:hypothetical protein
MLPFIRCIDPIFQTQKRTTRENSAVLEYIANYQLVQLASIFADLFLK